MKFQTNTPSRIALFYAIIAVVWLQLLDWLMLWLLPVDKMFSIHLLKGLAFILLSAAFLYLLLRRQFTALQNEITTRRQAAEALRLQALVLDQIQDCVTITDLTGNITYVNDAECRLLQRPREQLIGANVTSYGEDPARGATQPQIIASTLTAGEWRGEVLNYAADGTALIFDCRTRLIYNEAGDPVALCGISTDITAQKQLAAQLHQAQKMEAIGRLAGGIAHDFNNLLVPIVGYAELGLLRLPSTDPLYADLQRIKQAADRAAGLTRQILAFSRRQLLTMKAMNLNDVILEFRKLTQRLIGEDIAIQTTLAPSPPHIQADQGQLEQVLLNLAVNARDAMPTGGVLTIETANVVLDETFVTAHPGAQPGPHVMLAVSDTGCGMDAETQQRLFEPFFTTKAPGQGTGLGLATVFGIIKQHRGNIWVESEPGQGTTFKIYFPVVDGPAHPCPDELPVTSLLQGAETILVVEDEPGARQLVGDILQSHGYQLLVAEDPRKALDLVSTHPPPIHLLLTDVVLPEMNGRELYETISQTRPDLKVLYMSGYTDDAIADRGILKTGVAFLPKPFATHTLLQKVRAVLDAPSPQQR